jgi:predicted HicB family RNase H-like nuclease
MGNVPLSTITLRLPVDLMAWVQEQAESDDRSVNLWMTRLIRAARDAAEQA